MQGYGNRGVLCGTKSKPCNDLDFAIETVSRDNDTIVLLQNWEEQNSTKYRIPKTITINQDNLTIKALTGEYTFLPLDTKLQDEFPLFQVTNMTSRITFRGLVCPT